MFLATKQKTYNKGLSILFYDFLHFFKNGFGKKRNININTKYKLKQKGQGSAASPRGYSPGLQNHQESFRDLLSFQVSKPLDSWRDQREQDPSD